MPKYVNSPGSFSDLQIRSTRLRGLSKVNSFLTEDDKEMLHKYDKKLQELTKQAIRRLRDQDHSFVEIATEMNMSMNDVLVLGDYDPMTIKPR